MLILIDNRVEGEIFDEGKIKYIENIIREVLKEENCGDKYEISISFVTNEEMKELNHVYRGIDSSTDVLSFPMLDFFSKSGEESWREGYISTDTNIMLGDIVISIEKMKEQALEYGHSERRELSFLLIHGMLHLLGYDHTDKAGREVMFNKQKIILNRLNIKR